MHATGLYDLPVSTFFRNVDARVNPPRPLLVGNGRGPIASLKARAVLVDMEVCLPPLRSCRGRRRGSFRSSLLNRRAMALFFGWIW